MEKEQFNPQHIKHTRKMRFANTSTWKSPIPYLFGGIAVIFALIALALVILACTRQKEPSGVPNEAEESIGAATKIELVTVVVMAGDDVPKYLATPSSFEGSRY